MQEIQNDLIAIVREGRFDLIALRAGMSDVEAANGYKIVANLPYAVSTLWMDAVLAGPLPERMVLILQEEEAERYGATHRCKNFGATSIFLQSAYRVAAKTLC